MRIPHDWTIVFWGFVYPPYDPVIVVRISSDELNSEANQLHVSLVVTEQPTLSQGHGAQLTKKPIHQLPLTAIFPFRSLFYCDDGTQHCLNLCRRHPIPHIPYPFPRPLEGDPPS